MAISQTDLDNLDSAIASQELEVEFDGRKIKYRSTAELLAARVHVEGILRARAPRQATRFQFKFTTSRGD